MNLKTSKLGDVCDIRSGNSIPAKEKDDLYRNVSEGLPYVATKDIGFDASINFENGVRIPAKFAKKFRLSEKNSVLVCAEGGSAGRKIAYSNQDCYFVNKLFSIKPTTEIDSKYIYFYTLSNEFQKKFKESLHGLIGGVSLSKIKNFQITYPTLEEQKCIIAKLDVAFSEIDNKEQLNSEKLNNINKFKKSILDNLLGNNLIKLNEACDLIKRGISPKYLETGGVAVINQKCIRNHIIDYSKARRHNINLKKVPDERFIKKGDVLINSTGHGTLGRVAQVNRDPAEKTTVDSHVTIIRPKQKLFDLGYFANALIKIEKQLEAAGEGASGQTELSRSKLESEFNIPYIDSIDKQRKVSLMINSIFENIYILKNSTVKIIENLKSLKLSFLNKEFHNK